MYIDKIYLQENYRRHPGDDPFLFGTVGASVHINEGESVEEAEQKAKQYIQDYIERHTHYPEHNHVEVRDIQVDKSPEVNYETVIKEINKCQTKEDLRGWQAISFGNVDAIKAYAEKLKTLVI
jgi:predicted RNase H-like HicB family nuclease